MPQYIYSLSFRDLWIVIDLWIVMITKKQIILHSFDSSKNAFWLFYICFSCDYFSCICVAAPKSCCNTLNEMKSNFLVRIAKRLEGIKKIKNMCAISNTPRGSPNFRTYLLLVQNQGFVCVCCPPFLYRHAQRSVLVFFRFDKLFIHGHNTFTTILKYS